MKSSLALLALVPMLLVGPATRATAEEPVVLAEPDRLVESLRQGDSLQRTQTISALGKLNKVQQARAKDYERVLRAALTDADRSLRQMAAIGLVQLGHADQPILDELIRGLGASWKPTYGGEPDDPRAARAALVRLGEKAVPLLIAALDGENRQARILAVDALADIGPAAKDALPALDEALRTRPTENPVAILEAKYRIDGDAPAAVRKLVPLLDTEEGRGCGGASRVLGRMGAKAKDALPAMIEAMRKYKDSEIPSDLLDLAPCFRDEVVAAMREAQNNPDLESVGSDILRAIGPPMQPPHVPVKVTAEVQSAEIKAGRPIPLRVTIHNGLTGPILYSTFSLEPTDWNGETVRLSLVDIYREGNLGTRGLFRAAPKVEVPAGISGLAFHRIESGKTLTIRTDAAKWEITDGWKPGKYHVTVRVEKIEFDGGRCQLSVFAEPVEFELK